MTTKHNHVLVFGKRVSGCPRCEELNNGANPIQWCGSRRKQDEARLIKAIREHDCKRSCCGPVCTFGDY
jgi:hypothetical protein